MARTGPLWEPVLLLFAQEFDEADVLYYLSHFIICQIVRGVHEPPLQSGKIRLREIYLPPEIGFRHAIAGGNSGDVRSGRNRFSRLPARNKGSAFPAQARHKSAR